MDKKALNKFKNIWDKKASYKLKKIQKEEKKRIDTIKLGEWKKVEELFVDFFDKFKFKK